MPQPDPCASATTPSTFGYASSTPGRVNFDAISLATVAEQFTEASTPT
jgi:hypothetical protein